MVAVKRANTNRPYAAKRSISKLKRPLVPPRPLLCTAVPVEVKSEEPCATDEDESSLDTTKCLVCGCDTGSLTRQLCGKTFCDGEG